MTTDKPSSYAQWSVRGVSPEARNAATAAAERANVSIGEFLGRAILSQIKADRERGTSVATVPSTPTEPLSAAQILDDVTSLLTTAAAVSQVTGRPVPRYIATAANHAVRD